MSKIRSPGCVVSPADLLNRDLCQLLFDQDLRSEGSWPGAARRRYDRDDGAWQEHNPIGRRRHPFAPAASGPHPRRTPAPPSRGQRPRGGEGPPQFNERLADPLRLASPAVSGIARSALRFLVETYGY